MSTTATRAKPIGAGHLHNALEDARDLALLQSLCRTLQCAPVDVSLDGIRVDMRRVLGLMWQRGYDVGTPTRPQAQRRPGTTTWLVAITLPDAGPSLVLGFHVPNTS